MPNNFLFFSLSDRLIEFGCNLAHFLFENLLGVFCDARAVFVFDLVWLS